MAHAQQTEQPATEAQAADESGDDNEVVVLAQRGDEVRIDRRTYTLRQDPAAQSMNMFDVLGRVPSVSVAPSGAVTLLGADNVTIQINGQPAPGQNLEQVLRGIQGSDVERIEVISNPSAQYSAAASGGIINIITKQRFDAGLSGTVQASGDSLNGYHAGISPSWSTGRWAFSGQIGAYGGDQTNDLTRERRDLATDVVTTEEGARDLEYHGLYASRLTAAFQADERNRISLALDASEHNQSQVQNSDLADTLSGPLGAQRLTSDYANTYNGLTFDLQHDGDAPRELVKLSAAVAQFDQNIDNTNLFAPAGGPPNNRYDTTNDYSERSASLTFDVEHPFSEERFLTTGLSADTSETTIGNTLDAISGATPLPYDAEIRGSEQTLAAYATYQFATGDWTWLPGVRAEQYRREVISGGLESDATDDRLFPSLHIRRALSPSINIDVSYSSRIQRPGLPQLDPARRFVDVNRALSGNPNLEPTTTDAFEANFVYQKNGANFSVTFFDRISQDILSQFTDVAGDGVIVTMPVNAGESEQRGLQAMLRGPIGDHWRYSLTGNVLSREFDFLEGGSISRRSAVEYDGVASLDYRDADQNAVGADQLQLELRFQGPRHGLQTEIDQFMITNLTWRRKLTDRLSAVLGAYDVFNAADQVTDVTTADYVEHTEYAAPGTRVRLSLTYQFGNGPVRPPQDGPPPQAGPTF